MPDTTTQSIRSTGKRMGFSEEVTEEAAEEFMFGEDHTEGWAIPPKDWLFGAQWERIKPKRSSMF